MHMEEYYEYMQKKLCHVISTAFGRAGQDIPVFILYLNEILRSDWSLVGV